MTRKLFFLLFLFSVCSLSAQSDLTGMFRYRRGSLHRSKPTVVGPYAGRTKLRWDNLGIYSLVLEGKKEWWRHGYGRIEGELGAVGHGKISDRDFFYPEDLFFDSSLYDETSYGSKGGFFAAIKGLVGWRWCWERCALSFIPVVGVSFRELRLSLDQGKIFFPGESNLYRLESFPKHTKVRFHTGSYFLGVDTTWHPCQWLHIIGRGEIHASGFTERGCWHLRDYRFLSAAIGPGYVLELHALFPIQEGCQLGLQIGWERWRGFGLPEFYKDFTTEKEYFSKLYHNFFTNTFLSLTLTKAF